MGQFEQLGQFEDSTYEGEGQPQCWAGQRTSAVQELYKQIFSATGGLASLQSTVAREATVHEFCQRILCRCEDAAMGASTFECPWFYSGNREEETFCAGRFSTVIGLGKRHQPYTRAWVVTVPVRVMEREG